jgi:hypothetical protein
MYSYIIFYSTGIITENPSKYNPKNLDGLTDGPRWEFDG